MRIEIVALSNMPEVRRGDDLAALIRDTAKKEQHPIDRSVVLAVAQKIVSKAEGAIAVRAFVAEMWQTQFVFLRK